MDRKNVEYLLTLQGKDPKSADLLQTVDYMFRWVLGLNAIVKGYFRWSNVVPDSPALLFHIGTYAEQFDGYRALLRQQIANYTQRTAGDWDAKNYFCHGLKWFLENMRDKDGKPIGEEIQKELHTPEEIHDRMRALWIACQKARSGKGLVDASSTRKE